MALSKISNDMFTTISRPNSSPLIVNGDMAVAQRSTSVTGKTGNGFYTCDRMELSLSGLGTHTIIQEALTSGAAFNAGFANAWRIDTTTADGSPGSGDELLVQYPVEGQDLQVFKKGTASAEKWTLAFWVKCSNTGTGQVNLSDMDNNRQCSATYTISSADTWEHKILNFAADTTGAFGDDNGESLRIEWWLDSGSNYEGGAAPTAWETTANGDRNASGNLNIGSATTKDWAITGIQLEVGEFNSSTLPPFQHESYQENYERCLRYYYKLIPSTGFRYAGWGQVDNDDEVILGITWFKTHMRAAPSALEQSGTASHYKVREATTVTCDAVPTFTNADTWYAATSFKKDGITSSNGFAQGEPLKVGIDGGYLAWSAEL
jgi:hypothetical protein